MSVTSPGLMKIAGNMASTGLLPMPCSTSVSGSMSVHPVDLPQVTGSSVLELLNAVVGIAAVLGLFCLLLERPDHAGEGHLVRLAHAEIDELGAGMGRERGAFCTLDLLELVDLLFLAEHRAADPLGKQGLYIGVTSVAQR